MQQCKQKVISIPKGDNSKEVQHNRCHPCVGPAGAGGVGQKLGIKEMIFVLTD